MIDATQQPGVDAVQPEPDATRPLVTQAEYARHLGVNRSTVSRQVASGLIPTHDGLIDPVEADCARAQYLDQQKQRLRLAPTAPPASAPPACAPAPISSAAAQALPFEEEDSVAPTPGSLKAYQTEIAAARAELLKSKAAQQKGEVVFLREVEAAWGEQILNARNQLLQLPEDVPDPAVKARVKKRILEILADLAGFRVAQSEAVA